MCHRVRNQGRVNWVGARYASELEDKRAIGHQEEVTLLHSMCHVYGGQKDADYPD